MRKCPYCLATLQATSVLAHSNDLVCPGCSRPLEISSISRNVSVTAGLITGWLAWRWAVTPPQSDGPLGWVLPVVYAILGYAIVSQVVLMLLADLRLKHNAPASEMTPAAEISTGGHTSGHH